VVIRRISSLILTLCFGLIFSTELSESPARADEPAKTGRLQGRFTAAVTGEPVAGAKVKVLIEGVPFKDKTAEAVSGVDGRYTLEVPLGHVSYWGVYSSAGFYTQDPTTYGAVLTTAAEPQVTRDFVLQPGAAWRVEVEGATIPADKPAFFSAMPDPDANPDGYANSADIISTMSDPRGKAC
jgi:hypothetical protein